MGKSGQSDEGIGPSSKIVCLSPTILTYDF